MRVRFRAGPLSGAPVPGDDSPPSSPAHAPRSPSSRDRPGPHARPRIDPIPSSPHSAAPAGCPPSDHLPAYLASHSHPKSLIINRLSRPVGPGSVRPAGRRKESVATVSDPGRDSDSPREAVGSPPQVLTGTGRPRLGIAHRRRRQPRERSAGIDCTRFLFPSGRRHGGVPGGLGTPFPGFIRGTHRIVYVREGIDVFLVVSTGEELAGAEKQVARSPGVPARRRVLAGGSRASKAATVPAFLDPDLVRGRDQPRGDRGRRLQRRRPRRHGGRQPGRRGDRRRPPEQRATARSSRRSITRPGRTRSTPPRATSTATASSTSWSSARAVNVLLGNGDGTFAAPTSYAARARLATRSRSATSTTTASSTSRR